MDGFGGKGRSACSHLSIQKLFMFEAIYVFVIVAFTIGLIIVRVVRGDWKVDFELDEQSEKEEKDDQFFL